MTNLELQQEWISFAKESFYHNESPEHQNYSSISDEQWKDFGYVMGLLSKDWTYPTPDSSEERQWYRAFAEIITGGRDYCKEVSNRIVDGKSEHWGYDFHILRMFPFLDRILQ
tara:strand:+ start:456 stop:794 length:339 start_codon:yes stop_codon:yes gene_type:complete